MFHSGEAGEIENLEFKWGVKRNLGGRNGEVQFYGSFTYDGVDYGIHDCVYMHKEEETEPYIGKLVKIWEAADKKKKVKVHWFFHSSEILNWLGDEKVQANELFLASGEGAGVANVNPLEAIAGKCNVVCISKDSRNPQPSEQDLQMADYVFCRTFDVGHCTISDKMDDKVAGLPVVNIFNKKEGENIGNVPKLDSAKKEEPVEFETARTTTTTSENKPEAVPGKDLLGSEKGVKSAKDTGALDDRASKKARVDCSDKLFDSRNDIGVPKFSINSDRNKGKVLAACEVTRKPADVRGNWFRELPWEERIVSAQEQGTLVQLSNLDPTCTSKQVEDIIWHAFKENCTAKMVPRTAISSPHSEKVSHLLYLFVCSPLVGSIPPPRSVQKKFAFVGHLSIDINKHQMQKEWKEALSTSHYSQPNTIEYEMAMEWCWLQSISKSWWKKFYKEQGEELKKLKVNLKLK